MSTVNAERLTAIHLQARRARALAIGTLLLNGGRAVVRAVRLAAEVLSEARRARAALGSRVPSR